MLLLRALEALARRRRLTGGTHPAWTAVTVAIFLLRRYQRSQARDAIQLREELRPGETLVIRHLTETHG